MSKDELRVGFLGFGFIGKVHAYGYHTFPFYYPNLPDARFVAVCTSREESARAARELFGFERATTDFREVTEADDVDVVHIATPNRAHLDALLSAMAAGKHIYCEKPLVTSLDEARQVETALPHYTGTAQMVLQNRFFPATRRARALAEEGFLGEGLSFRAAYLHAGSADPEAPLKWKLDKATAGGGVLLDLGSHVIDLVTHLIGDFVEVDCRTRIAFDERPALDGSGRAPVEAEDLALVTARTAAGALGTVEATKIATGSLDELRFEIHGTRGAMRFNGMRPNWLEVYSCDDSDEGGWRALDMANQFPAPAAKFPGPKFSVGWVRSHVACLANFIDAVVRGALAEPSLARGIALQKMMDACYRSAQQLRPIAV
jgi:predicted dehydrogenase